MQRYLARRNLIAIPVLLGITVINFAIINLAPGDPLSHRFKGYGHLARVNARLSIRQHIVYLGFTLR